MHYSDLRVYQLSSELCDDLYKELSGIPYSWAIPEIDQVLRSSSSITSNIVEGFGRRFYPKDFKRFLVISLASSDETQNHIRILGKKTHLNEERASYFTKKYKTLSIQLLNYLNYIRKKHSI